MVVPRYYFDFRDPDDAVTDTEGVELADVEEALTEALAALCGRAKDELRDGDERQFPVTVRDGDAPSSQHFSCCTSCGHSMMSRPTRAA